MKHFRFALCALLLYDVVVGVACAYHNAGPDPQLPEWLRFMR